MCTADADDDYSDSGRGQDEGNLCLKVSLRSNGQQMNESSMDVIDNTSICYTVLDRGDSPSSEGNQSTQCKTWLKVLTRQMTDGMPIHLDAVECNKTNEFICVNGKKSELFSSV